MRNVRSSSRAFEKRTWGALYPDTTTTLSSVGGLFVFSSFLCLKSASGDDFTTFLILFNDTEKQ